MSLMFDQYKGFAPDDYDNYISGTSPYEDILSIHRTYSLISPVNGYYKNAETKEIVEFKTFEEAYNLLMHLYNIEQSSSQSHAYWQIKKNITKVYDKELVGLSDMFS